LSLGEGTVGGGVPEEGVWESRRKKEKKKIYTNIFGI